MNERPVRGIILAHGTMAAGMVDAVRRITGVAEDALVPLSNSGLSPEAIAADLGAHIEGPTIVFTDLPSGSCGFAARRYCKDLPEMVVISGINLALLLEFTMHRELPLTELVPRLVSKARAAITCSKPELESNEHRALSGR